MAENAGSDAGLEAALGDGLSVFAEGWIPQAEKERLMARPATAAANGRKRLEHIFLYPPVIGA
ncbi:hypothetical protein [Arthrobacter sp. QXT-31]|uniref:hypothetical protein n=1 Tax=Arthrobacter sp. QXT-31 TaxID=1357915 RepID=UPI000971AB29|nr:hypothetical protein [Arthrobacter sp. QXT-31]APX03214.1 hypothetical protein BWQ92_17145 [Arthrobacter sp. QXT-31]